MPIGDVVLSTVQGVSDYWVRLPRGSVPIRNIYTAGTPAVTDGRGVLMESLKVASSLVLDDCEDAWDEDTPANFTVALDNTDFKVGSNSVKVTITAAGVAGVILCEVIAPGTALPKYTHIEFWIKSSVATAAGDLQILLDDTAKCVSPLETLNVPALTAGVWRHCRLQLNNPQLDILIISLGLKYTVDIGAVEIKLDDFRAVTLARSYEALKVDDFIPDDVYFALSEGIVDDARTNRVLLVNYEGPKEDTRVPN